MAAEFETDNTTPIIAGERSAPAAPPAVDPPPASDDSPEAGIEALRQQILAGEARVVEAEKSRDNAFAARESERAAREEAERRSQQYRDEAGSATRTASDAQYDSVLNALAAAQGDLGQSKNSLKTAMAEGDFDKVAELSAEIGLTAARVRELESGKVALEARRQEGERRPAGGDPREDYIQSRTPRTAAWLRRNDRFFTDRNFQNMVQGAHGLAVGRGIQPDSDEYFSFIEELSGLRQPAAPPQQQQYAPAAPPVAGTTPVSAAAASAPRSSPMPAAPAAGTAATLSRAAAAGGTVSLTPAERAMARTLDMSEAAYAKQKVALLNEGLIGTGH